MKVKDRLTDLEMDVIVKSGDPELIKKLMYKFASELLDEDELTIMKTREKLEGNR